MNPRELLLAEYRRRDAETRPVTDAGAAGRFVSQYGWAVQLLESDAPVTVSCAVLRPLGVPGLGKAAWYQVDADGAVTPATLTPDTIPLPVAPALIPPELH